MTFFWAIVMGLILPVQAFINTKLSAHYGHAVWGSFLSFLGGTLVLGLTLLALKTSETGLPAGFNNGAPPWYLYLGGLLGAFFVTSIIFVGPKIGFTTMTFLIVMGQFVMSMVIDFHLGYIQEISLAKVGAILIMSFGVWLFRF